MSEVIEKKIKVYQKAKAEFNTKISKNGDGYDFTSTFNIIAYFPGTSGSVSVSKADSEISNVEATKGRIKITIPAAKTELMAIGEEQDFMIHVIENDGDDPEHFESEGCLFVFDTLA